MTRPLGEEAYASVSTGNILCARTLIIVWVAASLACWWLVEQPQGSWMQQHPCFQHVLRALNVYRYRLAMGDYGAKSQKPTWLYSSDLVEIEIQCFWRIWYSPLLLKPDLLTTVASEGVLPFLNNVLGESAIQELADFRPRRSRSSQNVVALVDRYVDSAGRVRIKGNSNLKASQSYPIPLLVFFQKGCVFE